MKERFWPPNVPWAPGRCSNPSRRRHGCCGRPAQGQWHPGNEKEGYRRGNQEMSHWQLLGKEAARVCFEPAFHPLCRLKQRISMPVFIVSAGRAPAEVPKSSLWRHRREDLEQQVTAQSWRDLLQPHLQHPARLWGAHKQKPWRFRARRRDAPAAPRPKAGAASPANKRLPRGEEFTATISRRSF